MVVVTPWQAWLIQSVFYLSLYQNENNCLAKDELSYIENLSEVGSSSGSTYHIKAY